MLFSLPSQRQWLMVQHINFNNNKSANQKQELPVVAMFVNG
jgi:hypothetical protein